MHITRAPCWHCCLQVACFVLFCVATALPGQNGMHMLFVTRGRPWNSRPASYPSRLSVCLVPLKQVPGLPRPTRLLLCCRGVDEPMQSVHDNHTRLGSSLGASLTAVQYAGAMSHVGGANGRLGWADRGCLGRALRPTYATAGTATTGQTQTHCLITARKRGQSFSHIPLGWTF